MKNEVATFGAGCFWGVQSAFRKVPGVVTTEVGYAGGELDNPSYEEVCTGKTGHAEVVRVEFDPKQTSYEDLLKVFWEVHDPTTMNRQGPDVGSQYRSVILYHSEKQKTQAMNHKEQSASRFSAPIVTTLEPLGKYFKAEEYHQNYLAKQGRS